MPDAPGIRLDAQLGRRRSDDERMLMLLQLRLHAARRFIEQSGELDRLRLQLHAPRRNTLEIEQLVDQL